MNSPFLSKVEFGWTNHMYIKIGWTSDMYIYNKKLINKEQRKKSIKI